jgi:tetratricopeptide (TPR) repeat protein
MAIFSEDTAAVQAWAEEALAIYRRLGDLPGIANATASLGVGLGEGGDWERARPFLQESLQLFREVGNEARVMWGTRTLAWAYAELGDLGRARALYEDALEQARASDNRLFASVVLGSLSWLAIKDGRIQQTPALLKESLRIKGEPGDLIETAVGLCHAAQTIALLGRAETAVQLISSFETLSEEIGGSWPWVTRMKEEALAAVRPNLDPADFDRAWREGRRLTPEKALTLALDALEAVS